jgi:hypothetical protein
LFPKHRAATRNRGRGAPRGRPGWRAAIRNRGRGAPHGCPGWRAAIRNRGRGTPRGCPGQKAAIRRLTEPPLQGDSLTHSPPLNHHQPPINCFCFQQHSRKKRLSHLFSYTFPLRSRVVNTRPLFSKTFPLRSVNFEEFFFGSMHFTRGFALRRETFCPSGGEPICGLCVALRLFSSVARGELWHGRIVFPAGRDPLPSFIQQF